LLDSISMRRSQAGLSMLEALVAVSLVVVVLLASVQVVTRVGAQIGYARTPLAERGSRAKSVASHWLQGELDYLRSRGYGYLTKAYLEVPPPWTREDGGAAVGRGWGGPLGGGGGRAPTAPPRGGERGPGSHVGRGGGLEP